MTIGMYLQWDGVPVLIADTMVSTNLTGEPSEEDVATYSGRLRNNVQAGGGKVFALLRKMSDVGPTVSYCWAGFLIEAQHFHTELVAFLEANPDAQLERFFDEYPPDDCKNLQVILLRSNGRQGTVFFINTADFEHHSGRRVALIGSGTSYLHHLIGGLAQTLAQPFSEAGLGQFVSHLYLSQVLDGTAGAIQRWGGTYEVRYDVGRGPVPFESMLSCLFEIPRSQHQNLPLVSHYYSFYKGDCYYSLCNGEPLVSIPFHIREGFGDFLANGKLDVAPKFLNIGFSYDRKLQLISVNTKLVKEFEFHQSVSGGLFLMPDGPTIRRAFEAFTSEHQTALASYRS